MEKIQITKVSDKIFNKKIRENGCYSSLCVDACCRKGCDVDKISYDYILLYKNDIENILGIPIEACFEENWSNQLDFLGGNSISSTVRNGRCPFHVSFGKGCLLWQMVIMDKCPVRMIPSTCRLYPITWDKGEMRLVAEVEKTCVYLDSPRREGLSLWETQQEAIQDIFHLTENIVIIPKG